MLDCHPCDLGLEETTMPAFYDCPLMRAFRDYIGELTACIDPEHIVSIDLTHVCDNVSSTWYGLKRMVFMTL